MVVKNTFKQKEMDQTKIGNLYKNLHIKLMLHDEKKCQKPADIKIRNKRTV